MTPFFKKELSEAEQRYDKYLRDLDAELVTIVTRLVYDTGFSLEPVTPMQRACEHIAKARLIIRQQRDRLAQPAKKKGNPKATASPPALLSAV